MTDTLIISPAQTRVLAAVINLHALNGRVTVREVCFMTGRALGTVKPHLDALAKEGLVTWEPGRQATLRPTVEVIAL